MGRLISDKFKEWNQECETNFKTLKNNEEELNRIFIDIYGLQDELTPEVEDKDITLKTNKAFRYKQKAKNDFLYDSIVELISYAVGCMFGRYSLDIEGLAYAGGEWDCNKYSTFIPDKDNIIPICDNEYFNEDIVTKFVEFIEVVYGADTKDENLSFISQSLGGTNFPIDTIRKYFLNDFYKDHAKMYQSRQIGRAHV